VPTEKTPITNFQDCVDAGNPAMESYPRQCRTPDGQHFVEDIGNELDKADLIRIDSPRPGSTVGNIIEITGQARGTWFFEGDFPLILYDNKGNILTEHYATAQSEWPASSSLVVSEAEPGETMTEEFVPFTSELEVDFGEATGGNLILKKANPSDLRENDDELRIPVIFKKGD